MASRVAIGGGFHFWTLRSLRIRLYEIRSLLSSFDLHSRRPKRRCGCEGRRALHGRAGNNPNLRQSNVPRQDESLHGWSHVGNRLPFGLGVEFDALYKRFDQTGSSINGGTAAKTGTSWEFPLLGKYRFGRSFAKPYAEGGVSLNHLSGYLLPFRTPISQQPEGPLHGRAWPLVRVSS